MRTVNRTGFTLIEIIIALALGSIVATVVYKSIVASQRATQAGVQQIDVRQNLRAGVTYMGSVIRELDAAENDITVATATRFQFRAMRWSAVQCQPPAASGASAVQYTIARRAFHGLRTPDAVEDSVLVFRDGDRFSRSDDSWIVGSLIGLGVGNCPNGSPATTITVEITAASGGQAAGIGGVFVGAPIRGFQAEEISLFQGPNGRWWLGDRTADRSGSWTAVRPLIGPLTAAGMALEYYDSTGAVTGVPTDIASVALTLRGESRERVRRGENVDFARDSLVTVIALRNNPRY